MWTAGFNKSSYLENGYPVTYKFTKWLRMLEDEGVLLFEGISSSRTTYLCVINHLIKELIIAEFYRCLEYGLNLRHNKNNNYTIDSIYSFKYLQKFLIQRERNKYYCFREDKRELHELCNVIENTTCINSTAKNCRKRKKFRSKYVRINPILAALARRDKIPNSGPD